MISINKGQINEVYLTLAEKTTVTVPQYLFEVTNATTKDVKYFYSDWVTKAQYQIFYILDSQNEVLTNGIVNFELSGFYTYKVYQQRNGLVPVGEPIEYGKVQVIAAPYTNEYYTNQTTTNKVYKNEQ